MGGVIGNEMTCIAASVSFDWENDAEWKEREPFCNDKLDMNSKEIWRLENRYIKHIEQAE